MSGVFLETRMGLGVDEMPVELLPLENFYRAEEYHQNYLDKNPGGYCHLNPELFNLV